MAQKKKPGRPLGTRTPGLGIPSRLVAIRKLKGLSQSEAAELVGVAVPTLRKLETGDRVGLADELLARLADAYNTSMDEIYGRSESALERFAAASPELQSTQLSGILAQLARIAQNRETLQFVDELMTLLAHELPEWTSLHGFREAPAPLRLTLLQELADALARLMRDRTAIKYVGALVLRYAIDSGIELQRQTGSGEREEAALSQRLNTIGQMFAPVDSHQVPLMTPSRFKVTDAQPSTTASKKRVRPPQRAKKKKK